MSRRLGRRYLLQRSPLSATLTREPVEWETVCKRLDEKSLRRTYWRFVNQPAHDTLYVYRMYDIDRDEVIT